jgi:cytochrome P450
VLDEIVLRLIEQRRKSGEDRGDALSMLLQSSDDDRQVRDEVMTLFVAGHETTANALTWTWYLLAKNPNVRERLRDELRADAETPYVDAVLNETLRLYPPAWILGRDARSTIEAAGWRLRKGATVLMSQLVMHRSPKYFDRPDEYLPERWLGDPPELPQFAYFPFGGGSRKCIGDRFAWSEARIHLSNIASRYTFDMESPDDIVHPEPIITLRPYGSVRMSSTRTCRLGMRSL